MNFSENKYDPIESIIFEKGLKISGIHFYKEMDMMLIVLNNQKVLRRKISNSPKLNKASLEALNDFEFVGKGVGIYWPALDEDLSLKGFLQEELVSLDPEIAA